MVQSDQNQPAQVAHPLSAGVVQQGNAASSRQVPAQQAPQQTPASPSARFYGYGAVRSQ